MMGHLEKHNRPRARVRGGGTENTRPNPPHPDTLEALAGRVAALCVSRHDPEAFHIAKDDLAKALRRLARDMRGRAA